MYHSIGPRVNLALVGMKNYGVISGLGYVSCSIVMALYSRTSLSRMAKIQGICPGQRIIRDNELRFGSKQFRIQRISSGTAGDPVERGPGEGGATVYAPPLAGVFARLASGGENGHYT